MLKYMKTFVFKTDMYHDITDHLCLTEEQIHKPFNVRLKVS